MKTCRCGCGRPPTPRTKFAEPCRQRWVRLGKPDILPPPKWTWAGGERDDRIEEYGEMRQEWGLSRAEAAVRAGRCARTIERWESDLRSRTPAPQHRGEGEVA